MGGSCSYSVYISIYKYKSIYIKKKSSFVSDDENSAIRRGEEEPDGRRRNHARLFLHRSSFLFFSSPRPVLQSSLRVLLSLVKPHPTPTPLHTTYALAVLSSPRACADNQVMRRDIPNNILDISVANIRCHQCTRTIEAPRREP